MLLFGLQDRASDFGPIRSWHNPAQHRWLRFSAVSLKVNAGPYFKTRHVNSSGPTRVQFLIFKLIPRKEVQQQMSLL